MALTTVRHLLQLLPFPLDRLSRREHVQVFSIHSLGANTILHNAVIVAQLLKRLGRPGVTKGLHLPERITPLPREYREADLAKFFKVAYDTEKALYSTFLLTGFREMEVVHLYSSDVNFDLQTTRVTSKPELGFYPKRWEEREVPIPIKLIELLKAHRPRPGCKLVFPSPTGNREYHMLDHCKAVAKRAALDEAQFDLKTSFDLRYSGSWDGVRCSYGTALDGAQIA